MEMAIPEGFTNNIRENELKSTNDVLDEATNILIKSFKPFGKRHKRKNHSTQYFGFIGTR